MVYVGDIGLLFLGIVVAVIGYILMRYARQIPNWVGMIILMIGIIIIIYWAILLAIAL